MARTTKAAHKPHVSTITAPKALSRLRSLLEQLSEVRSRGLESAVFSTWRQNVQGVLNEFYRRDSLQFEQFDRIQFAPLMFYTGQPTSEFILSFTGGIEQAEGFLMSRISELEEDIQDPRMIQPSSAVTTEKNKHKVFLVHGHDHGKIRLHVISQN